MEASYYSRHGRELKLSSLQCDENHANSMAAICFTQQMSLLQSNPFGAAKPIDAEARLKELEEKIAKEKV